MKLFKINIAITGFAVAVLSLVSCSKNPDSKITYNTDFSNKSLIRVFVATVNANRNYVYVDGKQVTGALLTSGSVFPSSGIFAAAIDPGVKSFQVRDTLPTSTQVPLTFAENMSTATNYTIFLYDTITTPKQKTVLTRFETPADTTCRLRFANFIYNPTAVPAIDVYSFKRGANVFTNVPVTGVTDFIPYASNLGVDTLYIREAGSSVNILKVAIGTTTFDRKRSYTLVYRGSHRGTKLATLFTDK